MKSVGKLEFVQELDPREKLETKKLLRDNMWPLVSMTYKLAKAPTHKFRAERSAPKLLNRADTRLESNKFIARDGLDFIVVIDLAETHPHS